MKSAKQLREGYTTGLCAAAAAKAALILLKTGERCQEIEITAPGGRVCRIPISEFSLEDGCARCSVIKESGDDPDVTNGVSIVAEIVTNTTHEIRIEGGKGIGRVTRPGLALAVGEPAINPVPRQHIISSIRELAEPEEGYTVTISCPEGEALAAKTYNPKLGIIGGISILGTTGIVRPMSEEAYRETLSLKLSVLHEAGVESVLFTPGNYGAEFITAHAHPDPDLIVTTGNYVGDMIDAACRYGIKRILFVGHIGKLIKVAGGIFNTHSRVADCRNEIFTALYTLYSGSADLVPTLMNALTTDQLVDAVEERGFYDFIAGRIKERCTVFADGAVEFECLLFNLTRGLLGMTGKAAVLLEELRERR